MTAASLLLLALPAASASPSSVDAPDQTQTAVSPRSRRPEIVHRVFGGIGVDRAPLVVGTGYSLRLQDLVDYRDLSVDVAIWAPVPGSPFDDFRFQLGAQFDVVELGRFRLAARNHWSAIRHSRKAYTAAAMNVSLGADAEVNWRFMAVGVRGEWIGNIATHLAHDAAYRNFNPEVRDGWYRGMARARKFGGYLTFVVRQVRIEPSAGLYSTPRTSVLRRNDWIISYVPFYATLVVAYDF